MSTVSASGMLVKSDFTSKLARKILSEKVNAPNSLANSMEFLTVNSLQVNGLKIGTKNFARL